MRDPVAFACALADPLRWRIVRLVFDQALCVCELAEILKVPQSTLSSQLRVIQRAELLECERRQKWLFYRVKPDFQPILRAVFREFEAAIAVDARLIRDRARAVALQEKREQICCPSPVVLIGGSRRRESTGASVPKSKSKSKSLTRS